jgi:hypothetical protein
VAERERTHYEGDGCQPPHELLPSEVFTSRRDMTREHWLGDDCEPAHGLRNPSTPTPYEQGQGGYWEYGRDPLGRDRVFVRLERRARPERRASLAELLADAQVRFWRCVHPDHHRVEWVGDVAHCQSCPLTSEHTRVWIEEIREDVRRELAAEHGAEG